MLEALYPGRIDLGLGRAPGGDARTARAVGGGKFPDAEDFPRQVWELTALLEGSLKEVRLQPEVDTVPEVWLLGSSDYSGALAAELGLSFAFAHFINPRGGDEVARAYRETFKSRGKPAQVIVCTFAIVADTDDEAGQRLALLGEDPTTRGIELTTVSQAMIDEARAEIEEIADGLGDAQDAAAEASRDVIRARAELDALDIDIAAQSALVSEHDMRITALRGSAEAAASALAAVRAAVERQQRALDAALARRADAEATLAGVDPDLVPEGSAAEYAAAYDAAQREATDAEAAVGSLRERLHAAEREVEALTAQTIGTQPCARRAATPQPRSSPSGAAGIRGLLGDAVKVTAGYEAAIAAALGPLAEGMLVDTRDDAFDTARLAREGDLGTVDIAIAGAATMRPAFPAIAGVVPARDVVTAPDGVLGILSYVVVAEDLDAALAAGPVLAAAEVGGPVTIVTRAGEVVTEYTCAPGQDRARSRLELAAERDAAAERRDEIAVVADSLREALADAARALETARQRTKAALTTLREHDAALAAHTEQVNRATVRHEAAIAECERLAAGLAQAEAARRRGRGLGAHPPTTSSPLRSRRRGRSSTRRPRRHARRRSRPRATPRCVPASTSRRSRSGSARARRASPQLERQREREREAAAEAARRAVIRRAQREVAAGGRGAAARRAGLGRALGRSQARVELAHGRVGAHGASPRSSTELRRQEAVVRERLAGLTESVHGLELQIHEKRLHVSGLLERVGVRARARRRHSRFGIWPGSARSPRSTEQEGDARPSIRRLRPYAAAPPPAGSRAQARPSSGA